MHYQIDITRVSHDRLEDEVMVINLTSGCYYSGSGPAADLWTLISQGAPVADIARLLAAEYACDQQTVLGDVEKCIGLLAGWGLILASEAPPESNAGFTLPKAARKAWIAPQFDEFTDMWDLIRYDPIHEVGDAGWPFASPTAKT